MIKLEIPEKSLNEANSSITKNI